MDAGHLQIASTSVNLSQLVDEWLDDLGALPDSPDVKIKRNFRAGFLWLARNATRPSSCKIFWRTRESTIVRVGEFGLLHVATAATSCSRLETTVERFRRAKTSSNGSIIARVLRPHRATGSA